MSLLPNPPAPPPIAWTIAGSDSCAGAGIQADLKTFTALGVHGCTVIAALTAQNSFSVRAVTAVPAAMLDAQIAALKDDMPPRAIKIGMLGDAESVHVLAKHLVELKVYTVLDPVMAASAGPPLISEDVVSLMKEILFPHIDLLTPNLSETETLVGYRLQDDETVERAARDLMALGVKSVIIKGSGAGSTVAQDFYCDSAQSFWLTSPRRDGKDARGTGCTFAAALAAAKAHGFSQADATVIAKAFVNQSRRLGYSVGKGMDILSHRPWPCAPEDLPWLTRTAAEGRARPLFPNCGDVPLGFYPVVDSAAWLERLLPLGVTTTQLRVKNLSGAALDDEIRRAILCARRHDCRLFINDYWQLAIEHGAYGVHLGQEDLDTADIQAIAQNGLRLGISTHCYEEMARAYACNPSYIAIGPIFPTTLKAMKFAPQTVDTFRLWRQILHYPVVAIGGIILESAGELADSGADGIAVVSDITKNADPEKRVKAWLAFFNSRQKVHASPAETKLQRRIA